mgnify:CR=1 FL=1
MNSLSSDSDSKYKIVCTKNNIILQKDTTKDLAYILSFCTIPSSDMFNKLKSQNLFFLLAKLNPDIIETIDITHGDETSQNILLVFKRFGKEFGLPQKSLYLKTLSCKMDETMIIVNAESVPYSGSIYNCTNIIAQYANICIKVVDNHIIVEYAFNIDLQEDLPSYMKDLPGLLMKKIFMRVKSYIENG